MAKLGLTSIDRALQNMLGHKPTMIGHPPTMKGHQPTMIWQQPTMIGHQTTIIGQKPLMMGHIPAMKGHRQRMMEHTNIANIEIPSLSILFLIPNMPLQAKNLPDWLISTFQGFRVLFWLGPNDLYEATVGFPT